jgi:D-alanyl-D-alanine carboxypeptidase
MEAGIEQVIETLSLHGVISDEFQQRDGSGVSVQNLVTPSAILSILTELRKKK